MSRTVFNFVILTIILTICSSTAQAQDQQPYYVIKPALVSVVFAPPAKTPASWLSASSFGTLQTTSQSRVKIKKQEIEFRRTLTASTFTYSFPSSATTPGIHTLRLGLIEPAQNCQSGQRIVKFTVNGVGTEAYDVAKEAGCQTPYLVDITLSLTSNELITISFDQQSSSSTLPPGIANLRLYEAAAPANAPLSAGDVNYKLDINGGVPIPNTQLVQAGGTLKLKKVGDIPNAAEVFKTGRSGSSFAVQFDVPSGTYDVKLGFVELEKKKCEIGGRVFNVLINGQVKLSGFDIFAVAKKCLKTTVQTFSAVSIDSITKPPLVLSFESIADEALVSYIQLTPSNKQCVPVTDDAEVTDDHLAHSVPGIYPPFVDTTGSGSILVNLDGRSSHTHFFAEGITGRITQYKWVDVESNKILSTKPTFSMRFPLGSTRIRLEVVDNVCSQDDDETIITVTGSKQPGQYCYYYLNLLDLPPAGKLDDAPVAPVFSRAFARMKLDNNVNLPFDNSQPYVIRCLFFIEFTAELGFTSADVKKDVKVGVNTDGTGDVRVFKGDGELLLDSTTSESSVSSFQASKGELQAFEVMFIKQSTNNIKLNFKINGATPKSIFHDKATILPIITSLSPGSGPSSGGTLVRVKGYGLIEPVSVFFGGQKGTVQSVTAASTDVFVRSPRLGNPGFVSVTAENANGMRSQSLAFEYGGRCDPPQFSKRQILLPNGKPVDLEEPTCATIWSDGRLYVGTRSGRVRAIEYDHRSLVVTKQCFSDVLSDPRYRLKNGDLSPRTILGITFDPADRKGRPYVTTSTLFWSKQNKIDPGDPLGWQNGNIERLKPIKAANGEGKCLERSAIVVSGLPIGSTDHSINEIVFDQNGDLLISVAGLTNGGLPGMNWGGNWESFYSSSILKAKLSRGKNFNGQIQYTNPTDPTIAQPTATTQQNFEIFATGFRNLFSLTMARNGEFFGIDMGIDCKFGHVASQCSEYDPRTESSRNRDVNLQGQSVVSRPGDKDECTYSGERNDKLLRIIAGKWYGHPNLQRAAALGTRHECQWVDPLNGRIAFNNQRPSAVYEHRIALLTSPMTGLREYGSNIFCGKMRGNLVVSRYKATKSVRYERSIDGGPIDTTGTQLTNTGGLRVDENHVGMLLYPKLYEPGVNVLVPQIASRAGLAIINVVPWRHARKGKTVMRIGGWGFGSDKSAVNVFVGGRKCKTLFAAFDFVTCKTPKWAGGAQQVDLKIVVGGAETIMPNAILYMNK